MNYTFDRTDMAVWLAAGCVAYCALRSAPAYNATLDYHTRHNALNSFAERALRRPLHTAHTHRRLRDTHRNGLVSTGISAVTLAFFWA
jgi:hypothetical protein